MQHPVLASICALFVLFAIPTFATYYARKSEIPSIVLFALFIVVQQLLFALGAAVFGSYAVSLPLAALLVVGIAIGIRRTHHAKVLEAGTAPHLSAPDRVPWVVFGIIFLTYTLIRANYSFISFINDPEHVGVEKLFNLSLQQSFLFGEDYPPEWIWLAGEPIRYYTFLKSIPGLAAWIARVVFGNAETGGVLFILSESFFGALPYGVICGWVFWFGRHAKSPSSVWVVAVLLSFFSFVGTHYHAVFLGLRAILTSTSLNWWQLSREVIPFTDNQYPAWLMMLGDNHAYMQVYFLQILFWGFALTVVLHEKFSLGLAAAVGALAAALVLSHPGSVLVDLTVFSAFFIILGGFWIANHRWCRLKLLAYYGVSAMIVAAAFLVFLYLPTGNVKLVVLSSELTSRTLPFLNLNFSVLLWLAVLLVTPAVFREAFQNLRINILRKVLIAVGAMLVIACALLDLSALSVMVFVAVLSFLVLYRENLSESEKVLSLFAVASFVIWLPPELVAFDHTIDSRVEWIRFQMGLRFWPEGYLLIPFAFTLAMIHRIGAHPLAQRWVGFACVIILVLVTSHIPGIMNRISRSPQATAEIDGFGEFARRYADDSAIVAYLRSLSAVERVVIAEACGIGDPRVPHHFGWPGRIAAFSGRVGICGWVRHAMLYNNPLTQTGFRGWSVEERSSLFLRSYSNFFMNVAVGQREQAQIELMTLRALGATHIVFGEFEKNLFPLFSLSQLNDLPVTVAFRASDGMGVIRIND